MINKLAPAGARAEGEEMTKTPGQFEPPKLITKAEREAQKAFRKDDAKKAMTEHEIAQKAFSTNRERLKAEWLAREAVTGPMFNPAPELPDDTPIDNVRFSTRIRTAVAAAGWKTVGEIREASDATLLSLQDLGKGSVAHLRETLGLPSEAGVRPHGPKAKGR
jgi:DNA-directed RNA polymerase alpha subunit